MEKLDNGDKYITWKDMVHVLDDIRTKLDIIIGQQPACRKEMEARIEPLEKGRKSLARVGERVVTAFIWILIVMALNAIRDPNFMKLLNSMKGAVP
jgi:hypothetical protein